MIENIGRIAAVALIVVILTVLLKKTSPDIAILLPMAFCVVILFLLAQYAGKIISQVESVAESIGLSIAYFSPLLKVVAIAVISKVFADICRDADETAIGNLVETAGAFAAIIVSLPLFSAACELLQELL